MTNIEKIDSVEEIKKALLEIEKLLKSDRKLGSRDFEVLNGMTTVLENQVKIKLFDKLVKSKDTSRIIDDIDKKIEELSKQSETLSLEELKYDSFNYKRQMDNYKHAINNLKELKEDYKNKAYEKLAKHTFGLDKEKDLITNCCNSLAVGYFEFETLFGKALAESNSHSVQPNYDVINNFFEIYQDQETVKKLKEYFSYDEKEKKMKEEKENALELNKILPVLENSANDIRTYLYFELIRKKYNHDIDNYKEQLKNECKKMKSSLFKNFKKNKIEKLEKEISRMDMLFGEKISTLEEKLKDLGIYNYVEEIIKTMNGNNNFIHDPHGAKEKIGSLYWFSSKNSYYDIGDKRINNIDFGEIPFKREIEVNSKKLQSIEDELTTVKKLKDEIYEKLPSQTKTQLVKDPSGMKMVAQMDERPERYGCSPIVCAYILKVIGQAKNISLQDTVDIIKIDQQKINKLETEYLKILERELDSQQNNVDLIYSQGIKK